MRASLTRSMLLATLAVATASLSFGANAAGFASAGGGNGVGGVGGVGGVSGPAGGSDGHGPAITNQVRKPNEPIYGHVVVLPKLGSCVRDYRVASEDLAAPIPGYRKSCANHRMKQIVVFDDPDAPDGQAVLDP